VAQLERSSIEAYVGIGIALLLWLLDRASVRPPRLIFSLGCFAIVCLLLDAVWRSRLTIALPVGLRILLSLWIVVGGLCGAWLLSLRQGKSEARIETQLASLDRPWVVAEGVVASPLRVETLGTIRLRLRNSGEAPAFRVKASGWFYVRPLGTPNPDSLERSEIPPGGTTTIGKGGFVDLTVALKPEQMVLLDEARSGRAVLTFDGFCDYFDSRENPHRFRFCVEFDPNVGQWNFCGEHNRQEF
jgi:hypothetical protein